MKKLIKLSDTHYVVVDDSEIKEGEWFLPISGIGWEINKPRQADNANGHNNDHCKKITHSTLIGGLSAMLEIGVKELSLSEVEETINGYSVEKMAEEETIRNEFNSEKSYIKGFNAHKELLKEENKEVIELLTNITEWSSFKEHPIGKQAQRALELLTPKTEWDVEIIDGKIKLIQ